VGTDDQNLALAGNTLSIEDGNNVDLSGYLDNTDDQNLTGATLTGNTLQIDIENGTSASVDLSALDNSGTDDQALSLAGNTLTLEDGGSVDLSGYVSTDDQNLALAGNTLSIEDGNNVDLSGYLDNTDDQNIQNLGLAGTTLTVGIESGSSQTVDLASLVGTDDQNLALAGNTLSIEDGNNVDLSGYLDNTDDQNLTGATLTGNTLQIDIENGTSASVDLSALDNSGTDDQALSLAGNTLTLEDGGSVDLSGYVSTDDQNIQNLGLAGTTLTVGIESGTSQTVDLASLVGTDDQVISTTGAAGNITIESGNTLNLNVNDADADPTNERNTAFAVNGANLDITDSGGTLSVPIASLGTDTQDLSIDGTGKIISLVDGGSVTINADDADANPTNEIQTLSRAGTNVSLSLGGGTVSIADNDNDPANERNTAFTVSGGNLNLTDSGGTLSVPVSSLGTDNQTLSTNGTAGYIAISGGNNTTINVNDADFVVGNEYNTAFAVVGPNLTITDGGAARSVPLSSLGTDDQYDDEVPLRTPIDVDDAGKSVAQGYVVENNVQQVINAIAPITSKAARIFYPPSIAVDASTNGTGRTLNLYTQYTAQFATPAVSSAGAPTAIPTYTAAELYYYVTYYDPAVFANVSINASGVMTYDVIAQPSDYNSLINVVFVVR
jgi:hypothetical protein